MQVVDRRKALSIPPVWRLAFRPFFLAGGVYALLAIPLWVAAWTGFWPGFQPTGGWLAWHRHEMLFGFAMAIVAGFLLTAVQTWTGQVAPSGNRLMGVALIWLAARLGWLLGLPAPLLVPLTSFQSAIIVYFVQHRAQGPRALAMPLGAVTAVGIVGAGAAWLLGPWLIRVLFGAEFELSGPVLAALTAASVGTAALMVTGNAALAFDRHLLYNVGWWIAVVAAAALLVALPGSLDVRAAIALVAGPGVGVLVHVAGLVVVAKNKGVRT